MTTLSNIIFCGLIPWNGSVLSHKTPFWITTRGRKFRLFLAVFSVRSWKQAGGTRAFQIIYEKPMPLQCRSDGQVWTSQAPRSTVMLHHIINASSYHQCNSAGMVFHTWLNSPCSGWICAASVLTAHRTVTLQLRPCKVAHPFLNLWPSELIWGQPLSLFTGAAPCPQRWHHRKSETWHNFTMANVDIYIRKVFLTHFPFPLIGKTTRIGRMLFCHRNHPDLIFIWRRKFMWEGNWGPSASCYRKC